MTTDDNSIRKEAYDMWFYPSNYKYSILYKIYETASEEYVVYGKPRPFSYLICSEMIFNGALTVEFMEDNRYPSQQELEYEWKIREYIEKNLWKPLVNVLKSNQRCHPFNYYAMLSRKVIHGITLEDRCAINSIHSKKTHSKELIMKDWEHPILTTNSILNWWYGQRLYQNEILHSQEQIIL